MDKASDITLRQIVPIIGIGGEMVDITINTPNKASSMSVNSNEIPEIFSDKVLESKVSYIRANESRIFLNVVVEDSSK